jgi:hypothetical protein
VQFALVTLLLFGAATLIASPLIWRTRRAVGDRDADLTALEAAKEAKFREIRDAELDFRTGKLSREDFRALDTALRAEAIDLLRRLDALHGRRVTPRRGGRRRWPLRRSSAPRRWWGCSPTACS